MELVTRLGKVRGVAKPGIISFHGLPFAKPPLGDLRWKAPEPYGSWDGVLDATQPAKRAFQPPLPEALSNLEIPGEMSEDMLVLNVHTPCPSAGPRPVLVWIHGGGYIQGSANDFDVSKFANDYDIVVVAINYRLGMFGFLDLSQFGKDYEGSASNGFRDQILALKWVKDNIDDYGGDPENITISGGSAGGGSVLALQSAPTAVGLFQKAIALSPSSIGVSPPDVVTPYSGALGQTPEAFFEDLKSKSGEEIFAMQTQAGIGGLAAIDGVVLPTPIVEGIAKGVNTVPMILGTTRDEGPLLTDAIGNDPQIYQFFEIGLAQQIGDGDTTKYIEYLNSIAADYSPEDRMSKVWTDTFRASALKTASAVSDLGVPAYLYRWDLPTPHPYGPTHGADIQFAFNLFTPDEKVRVNPLYPNTAENRAVAATWSSVLAKFIRSGVASWPGLPAWPVYSKSRRSSLVIDRNTTVIDGLDPTEELAAFGLVP